MLRPQRSDQLALWACLCRVRLGAAAGGGAGTGGGGGPTGSCDRVFIVDLNQDELTRSVCASQDTRESIASCLADEIENALPWLRYTLQTRFTDNLVGITWQNDEVKSYIGYSGPRGPGCTEDDTTLSASYELTSPCTT